MNKNFCELNLTDRSAVEEGADLCDAAQADWIQSAFSPYKSEKHGFDDRYFESAGLIINAKPTFAQAYSRCGMSKNGGRCWCNRNKVCSRCAEWVGKQLLRTFGNCYSGRTWHSFTLSFRGGLTLSDANALSGDLWDLLFNVFKAKMKEWKVDGALYAEELFIRELMPALVNPHAHALVNAVDMPGDAAEQLEKVINQKLRRKKYRALGLKADVVVKPVAELKHYRNMLPYLCKPIDLITPYKSALNTKVMGDVKKQVALNSDMTDVVKMLSTLENNRKRRRYLGNMAFNSKEYIGVKVARPRRKKRVIKSFAQQIAEEKSFCE